MTVEKKWINVHCKTYKFITFVVYNIMRVMSLQKYATVKTTYKHSKNRENRPRKWTHQKHRGAYNIFYRVLHELSETTQSLIIFPTNYSFVRPETLTVRRGKLCMRIAWRWGWCDEKRPTKNQWPQWWRAGAGGCALPLRSVFTVRETRHDWCRN